MFEISHFSELLIVGGQMVAFLSFLKYILHVAQRNISQDYPILKEDDFLKEYGYSWDYVFVFNVYDEDEKDHMTAFQKEFTMKNVIDRIENAEMQTQCFYSVQRDEVYVKVRCVPTRLKEEASRINYNLLLDKNRLRVKAQSGKKSENGQSYVWNPITITDEFKISSITPYEYIYGSFINTSEFATLYTQYDIGDRKYPFKTIDRIKLIMSIFQNRVSDEIPGAGLNMGKMIAKAVTIGQFPIHNFDDLNRLQKRWLVLWQWPWNLPLDLIRDYFGERIGFYFLYLQHYTTMLLGPAVLGVVCEVLAVLGTKTQVIPMTVSEIAYMVYLCIMLFWSTIYVAIWKGKQSTLGMQWGMTGYEANELDRPLFEGVDVRSPIDGTHMRYFPDKIKKYRNNVVNVVTLISIAGVVTVVGCIFLFQAWADLAENKKYFTIGDTYLGTTLVSIMMGLAINILNILYNGTALAMNEWENHRTDTEFEDKLISKIFLFQMVNSFAAVTYIAFIKGQISACIQNDCDKEVSSNISIIFITTLVARMGTQVLVSMYTQHLKALSATDGIEPGAVRSPLEEQYSLEFYDALLVTLQDYAALVIQFGFTVLFVAVYPLAPTISFVNAYIQIRIDGWKLCQAYQRPEPKSVEDIGVWQNMIEVLSYLAVIYNLGLMFFSGQLFANYSWTIRWILFVFLQNILLFAKYCISIFVEEMPREVEMQLERQEFLVSKVLYDKKDEDGDDTVSKGNKGPANIIIEQTDYDWILPGLSQEEELMNVNIDDIHEDGDDKDNM